MSHDKFVVKSAVKILPLKIDEILVDVFYIFTTALKVFQHCRNMLTSVMLNSRPSFNIMDVISDSGSGTNIKYVGSIGVLFQ